MNPDVAQQLESYVPVYDAIPESWEEGRQFLTEQLKRISNAINVREIGWFLDEELLAGKFIFPGTFTEGNSAPLQNRQILRFTIDSGALTTGANVITTTIVFDTTFRLFDCWVAATDVGTLTAQIITDVNVKLTEVGGVVEVTITSPGNFSNSFLILEYSQEG